MLGTMNKIPTVAVPDQTFQPQPLKVMAAYALIERVRKFRSYGDNWGTYNERAVCESACDQAEHFISNFAFWKPTVKLHVYPTSGGDIGIDWRRGDTAFTAIFTGSDVQLLIDDDSSDSEDMQEYTYPGEVHLLYSLRSRGFEGV
jgi:hypothetical protein